MNGYDQSPSYFQLVFTRPGAEAPECYWMSAREHWLDGDLPRDQDDLAYLVFPTIPFKVCGASACDAALAGSTEAFRTIDFWPGGESDACEIQ